MNEAKLKSEGNMSKIERRWSTKGSKRRHSKRIKTLVNRGLRRWNKLVCRHQDDE